MNLVNRISFDDLIKNKSEIKKIFFYRICGTGMGACACILKEKGYDVEGGDNNFYPPMSQYLESTGITTCNLNEMDCSYLKSFDLIVVGNVVPKNSEDAKIIEECDTPFISFPSALGALVLKDQNVVGIAGTHGKTTTTYFLSQMFEYLGMSPGYFIGGVMDGRAPSRLGDGKYFFIESDEYDCAYFEKVSKFRLYSLDHLILTSLELDHADIFENIEQIKNEFRELIPNVSGQHIYCDDYQENKNLANEFLNCNPVYYGGATEYGPHNIIVQENKTSFTLNYKNENYSFETNIIGNHNILNITSCILFALKEGIELEKIQQSVQKLSLVKRRQEFKGYFGKSIVIDDFAHHPKAVLVTIDAIKDSYPGKKIIVVMEPHSATARSSIFQEGFTESLKLADKVLVTKLPKPTTARGADDLDLEKMIADLNSSDTESFIINNLKELREKLDSFKISEHIILILSNGTCLGLWQSSFVEELEQQKK
jgi:UDP-N-acetylmuramate: L-alanyl-gamma-D-glutamyl-meso-diaminopimelate ligase